LIKLHLDQSKVKKRTFEVLCFTNKNTKNDFVEKYEVDCRVLLSSRCFLAKLDSCVMQYSKYSFHHFHALRSSLSFSSFCRYIFYTVTVFVVVEQLGLFFTFSCVDGGSGGDQLD
jgi:hypothetical protein